MINSGSDEKTAVISPSKLYNKSSKSATKAFALEHQNSALYPEEQASKQPSSHKKEKAAMIPGAAYRRKDIGKLTSFEERHKDEDQYFMH